MTGPAAIERPARRVGTRGTRLVAVVTLALVGAAACSSGGDDAGSTDGDAAATAATTTTAPDQVVSPLADAVEVLPPAPALPDVPVAGPEPTGLSIDTLDVSGAPVRAVGVEGDGKMEIPGVREVGWYRYGAAPGQPGSTVLAAHVAYDGVDGVFRHLDDLESGDAVSVTMGDGSTRSYVVTEVSQHPKTDLPPEAFARDGAERLVLITCGGEFDSSADSYEDNVIAYAEPA